LLHEVGLYGQILILMLPHIVDPQYLDAAVAALMAAAASST
jgi:hypothetical protein